MQAVIEYVKQIFYISLVQTSSLIVLEIFLLIFIIVININEPKINIFFSKLFSVLFILLGLYLLVNSHINLISKGQLSLIRPQCQQIVIFDEFNAEIQKCNQYNTDSYNFELLITNKKKEKKIYICANQTRLLDWSGNNNFAQKVSLGSGHFQGSVNTMMPRNIPIKVNIVFENTYVKGNVISLLDIKTNNGNIRFHNILISD